MGQQHLGQQVKRRPTTKISSILYTRCVSMPGCILASSSGFRTEITDRAVGQSGTFVACIYLALRLTGALFGLFVVIKFLGGLAEQWLQNLARRLNVQLSNSC